MNRSTCSTRKQKITKQGRRTKHPASPTVRQASAMKGLRMAVVTVTRWSMTPWSSGSVTLAMLKVLRMVSDRRLRQPRGSLALETRGASLGHSRLLEEREEIQTQMHGTELT